MVVVVRGYRGFVMHGESQAPVDNTHTARADCLTLGSLLTLLVVAKGGGHGRPALPALLARAADGPHGVEENAHHVLLVQLQGPLRLLVSVVGTVLLVLHHHGLVVLVLLLLNLLLPRRHHEHDLLALRLRLPQRHVHQPLPAALHHLVLLFVQPARFALPVVAATRLLLLLLEVDLCGVYM